MEKTLDLSKIELSFVKMMSMRASKSAQQMSLNSDLTVETIQSMRKD